MPVLHERERIACKMRLRKGLRLKLCPGLAAFADSALGGPRTDSFHGGKPLTFCEESARGVLIAVRAWRSAVRPCSPGLAGYCDAVLLNRHRSCL